MVKKNLSLLEAVQVALHQVIGAYAIAMNDGRVPGHFSLPAIEAEVGIGTTLSDERNTFLNKAVTASVEDFDKIYDEGLANYMSIGGQDIMEERAEKLEAATGYVHQDD